MQKPLQVRKYFLIKVVLIKIVNTKYLLTTTQNESNSLYISSYLGSTVKTLTGILQSNGLIFSPVFMYSKGLLNIYDHERQVQFP